MAFTLTAIPHLLPEGEHKGHLEYVQFVAMEGSVKHKWSSVNVGTYAEDFAKIVPTDLARLILSRLRNGETVTFPGLWDLEQIKHQFGGNGND
jgi:hypothetical protein